MRHTILWVSLLTFVYACNLSPKQKSEQKESTTFDTREAVLDYLHRVVASNQILFGHEDATLYGHTWFGERGRSDVKEVCGSYPAVIGFDLGGIEKQHAASLDSVPFNNIREAIIDHHARGGLVTISWHLDNPVTGGNSWDIACDTVVHSILSGGAHHATFCLWIDRLADFLLSLQTHDGKQIPIIFRPWHEHTGSWFWWGRDLCSIEEYQALWHFTRAHLEEKGLHQLVYAYSPNVGVDAEGYMERYPGDALIDLLGFDIYQREVRDEQGNVIDNGTSNYVKEMQQSLSYLTELGKKHQKPIAITETGWEGIPMEKWWTEVLHAHIQPFPIAYVLVWRNACDRPAHFYAPFPGHVSEKDFVQFSQLPNTIFINP